MRAIYQDSNGNGRIDPGEPIVSGSLPLTAGQSVPLLLKVTLPLAAPNGTSLQIALRADVNFSNASPVLTYSATSFDIAEVLASYAGALQLSKSVDKAMAQPGATLIYTINFTNTGRDAIRNLVINDSTPPYTTFAASNVVTLPIGIGTATVTAPTIGTGGAIRWVFSGELLPSASGVVQFSVVIEL